MRSSKCGICEAKRRTWNQSGGLADASPAAGVKTKEVSYNSSDWKQNSPTRHNGANTSPRVCWA
jgi:hypothetical protein